MIKKMGLYLLVALAGLYFASCQTAKAVPAIVEAAPVAEVAAVPVAEAIPEAAPVIDPLAGNSSSIQSESRGLSPNGDGFADTVTLSLFVGNKDLLSDWSIQIVSQDGSVRRFEGTAPAPAEILWDGKNDAGELAPEGAYTALASLSYGSSASVLEISTKTFVLDTSPPRGTVLIDPPSGLVPAAGGVASPLGISIEAESTVAAINSWSLEIYGPDGKRFSAFAGWWPAQSFIWDGKSTSGVPVAALSSYKAQLTIRDEFGLEGKSMATIAVADLPLSKDLNGIEARRSGFSPTSLSVKNSLDLLLSFGARDIVKTWSVAIYSPTTGLKREFKGTAALIPEFVAWDGKDQSGKAAAAGNYFATLSVGYGDAFKPVSVKSSAFAVVTNSPKGSLSIDPAVLDFDGKGGLETAAIIIRPLKSAAAMGKWTMLITASDKSVVASYAGTWPQDSAQWDGRDKAGLVANPGAKYAVTALVNDEYGNQGRFTGTIATGDLPEVSEATQVIPQSAGFSPNGDGFMDSMVLALSYGEPQALDTWCMNIVAAGDSTAIRSYTGTSASLPSTISWDGLNEAGEQAPEGSYQAALQVTYGKAFEAVQIASTSFINDTTAPKVSLSASPDLFSPDADGQDDMATFKIVPLGGETDIAAWTMSIFDPAGNLFADFNGDWPNDSQVWDGRGLGGALVESAEDYVLRARIGDRFGNVTEVRDSIPIDILVIKTDDGYRIRIASIVFKAFTADFINVMPDRAKRNQATLALLTKKLEKFPDYGISIVGHAVMINWDDVVAGNAEQAAILLPLSRERSASIKTALVQRGIPDGRMDTMGVGALDQAVLDSDLANRWKNRRVDFILKR